jgi:hypothetical protein
MTRLFGLAVVLSALAVGAYLLAVQSQKEGPTANAVTQVEAEAASAAAGTNFQDVRARRERRSVVGSVRGVRVPRRRCRPGLLVRADTSGYCLQTPAGSAVEHELGPGGSPQPGPC